MRILLDTNIIIEREGHQLRNPSVAELYKWLEKLQYFKVVHPKTKKEIRKYHDEKIRSNILTNLTSYEEILPNDEYDNEFIKCISNYKLDENSQIDNSMLFQVRNKVVDIFITEDKNILKKASELLMQNKVFSISTFLKKMNAENPSLLEYKLLSIKKVKFGELNLQNDFFDSLRDSYGEKKFNEWYRRKNSEMAYISKSDNGLYKGFLYIKKENENENYSDITPQLKPKKRLKIGTFKVISLGTRLGEKFLEIIFRNALKMEIQEIYVTLFKEKDNIQPLYGLFEKFGFEEWGEKTNGETVLIKKLDKGYRNEIPPIKNFPIIKDYSDVFILPIEAKFHTNLFPESYLKMEEKDIMNLKGKAHRNAIEKVYISGMKKNDIKIGDKVLIYRKGETLPKKYSSVITTLTIVSEIKIAKNIDEMILFCSNRSVFEEEEIRSLWPKKQMIIKLLNYKNLDKKIMLNDLHNLKIIEPPGGTNYLKKITLKGYNEIMNF